MDGRLPVILSGRNCRVGIESTVLDLTGEAPVVLRPGIVSAASIERVLSKRVVYLKEDAPSAKLNSPGLRYRHYAPCCEMALNLDGDREKIFARYREAVQAGKNPVLLCGMEREENFEDAETVCLGSTDEECARNLFGALRALEKKTRLHHSRLDEKRRGGRQRFEPSQKVGGQQHFLICEKGSDII